MYDQSKDTMFIMSGMELMEKCILPSEMEAWHALKTLILKEDGSFDHRFILDNYRGRRSMMGDDDAYDGSGDSSYDGSSLTGGGGGSTRDGGGVSSTRDGGDVSSTHGGGGSTVGHLPGGPAGPPLDGSTAPRRPGSAPRSGPAGPPQGGGAGRGGFGGGAARRQDDPARSHGGAADQDQERARRTEEAHRRDGERIRQQTLPPIPKNGRKPFDDHHPGSERREPVEHTEASSTWLGVAKLAYEANMPTAKYMQENNVSMRGSEGGCYSLDNALTTMPYVWDLTTPRPEGTMMPTSLETINKLIPSVTNEMINFMLQPIDIADPLATPAKLDKILCRVLAPAMGIPYLETGAVDGLDWENPLNKAHPVNSPYKYSRLFMINAYMAAHGTEDVQLFDDLKIIETGLGMWCGANNSAEGLHKLATEKVNGTVFENMLFSPAENTCFTEAWSKWFEAQPTKSVNDPEFLLYATRSCMHGLFMHKDHLYTNFTMNATRGVMLGVDFNIYADVDDEHDELTNIPDSKGMCSFRNSWDRKNPPQPAEEEYDKYAIMRRNLDLNSSGEMYPKPSGKAYTRYKQHDESRADMEPLLDSIMGYPL
ncbi:hypothetical protein T484DRAFT_1758053, partial [Baffinella frigidus]